MKKALIITYYWPPASGSGVQRWLKFAKFMPQFDWKPIVYTPTNPNIGLTDEKLNDDVPQIAEILRTPIHDPSSWLNLFSNKNEVNDGHSRNESNSWIYRLGRWVKAHFFIPDSRIWWKSKSIRFLNTYLSDHPVDLIISTGPPHSLHLIAERLAEKWDIPWIVDLRDPMSKLISFQKTHPPAHAINRYKRIERRILGAASEVIATSSGMKDALEEFDNEKFHVITNGFDPDDLPSHPQLDPHHIIMSYAGHMSEHQIPSNLWQALDQRIESDTNFRALFLLKIAGTISPKAQDALMSYSSLWAHTQMIGHIEHDQVLELNASSHIQLLLNFKSSEYTKGVIPGKLFEQIAVRRPILSLGPDQSDYISLMSGHPSFSHFDYNDKNALSAYVSSLNREELANSPLPSEYFVNQFSRIELTRRLSEIMDQCLA